MSKGGIWLIRKGIRDQNYPPKRGNLPSAETFFLSHNTDFLPGQKDSVIIH